LLVVAFNLVMLVLLDVPSLSFAIAPDRTIRAIDRAKTWIARHGQFVVIRLIVLGGACDRAAEQRTASGATSFRVVSVEPDGRSRNRLRSPA